MIKDGREFLPYDMIPDLKCVENFVKWLQHEDVATTTQRSQLTGWTSNSSA
jgi:hypothetical protein